MGQRSVAVLCQVIVKLEEKRKTRLYLYLKYYLVHCDFFALILLLKIAVLFISVTKIFDISLQFVLR